MTIGVNAHKGVYLLVAWSYWQTSLGLMVGINVVVGGGGVITTDWVGQDEKP